MGCNSTYVAWTDTSIRDGPTPPACPDRREKRRRPRPSMPAPRVGEGGGATPLLRQRLDLFLQGGDLPVAADGRAGLPDDERRRQRLNPLVYGRLASHPA